MSPPLLIHLTLHSGTDIFFFTYRPLPDRLGHDCNHAVRHDVLDRCLHPLGCVRARRFHLPPFIVWLRLPALRTLQCVSFFLFPSFFFLLSLSFFLSQPLQMNNSIAPQCSPDSVTAAAHPSLQEPQF